MGEFVTEFSGLRLTDADRAGGKAPISARSSPRVSRAETLLTEALDGRHPRDLIARGEQQLFVDRMSESLCRIAEPFGSRPVVYRTTDFRSNEFRALRGGEHYEPVEHDPMIGYRGCYRYIREPDLFAVELAALARARQRHPNLHVMIPFVRTRWELEACLELIDASPLGHQRVS